MVFVTVPAQRVAALAEHLKQREVLVLPASRLRLVTHLDVDEAGIERAARAFGEFFAQLSDTEAGAPSRVNTAGAGRLL